MYDGKTGFSSGSLTIAVFGKAVINGLPPIAGLWAEVTGLFPRKCFQGTFRSTVSSNPYGLRSSADAVAGDVAPLRSEGSHRMEPSVRQGFWRRTPVGLGQAQSRRRRGTFLRLLGLGAALLSGSDGWSDSFCWAESAAASPEAREILKRGTIEAGGNIGFWQALSVPFQEPSANRSALFIMPRIGMVVTDEVLDGALMGNLEVLVEPFFARFTQPFAAEAAGGALVFKYNFLSFGRWMPFWEAKAGMLWTNLAPRIPEQSLPFNFILETGPGVQYFMTTRIALTLGVRYSHISNAEIGQRNIGLNAVLPYAGLS